MKFFQYSKDGQVKAGVLWNNKPVCFTDWAQQNMPEIQTDPDDPLMKLIARDVFNRSLLDTVAGLLESTSIDEFIPGADIEYLPPVTNPMRILAIGRNYAEHARELGNVVPDTLLFFEKSRTCLQAHLKPVIVPSWVEGRVDHEIELAVILKSGGKHISRDDAMNCVAGYSIFNDVTARDLQAKDKSAGKPWFKSKCVDTFGPMGPFFVPACFLPDPHKLQLVLKVNDEIRQKGSTADMIFRVPDVISILSRYVALHPGDVIITGTPAGVSPLHHGDVMTASIDQLGTLENPVVFE